MESGNLAKGTPKKKKKKKVKGTYLNDTKKLSFLQKCIDTWNGLKEEVIMVKNVH